MKIEQELHTKDRVIQESLRLFHEQGFQATTMRQIAEAVGCDVANIYNYTESKQAILVRFVAEVSDTLLREMKEIIDSNKKPIDKIKAVVSLHCLMFERFGIQVSVFLNEWKSLNEKSKKAYLDSRKSIEDDVVEILKRGMRDKVFKIEDPSISAKSLLSSFIWIYDSDFDQFELTQLEKDLTESVLRSLGA